ncbi:hypothetical protein PPL_08060 [Heterostelium album PN500]|uniref:Uncharacterized protein n=1 Tax=Heterostelium pallidum (strain ATCC 26659 / Pp 5 / PN500) TaxID=670386 RepID=D3BII1_HETP5|nr:hypothetical protein PPL_08060 [Heterostelium album PN500]EFA78605.1 hypothetical protein PPL_08060 [Heterostelium album PN500]|eukprot:XP_020430729.1 hypothetical protein PPL_08060 [Heterostelium album PN500]
MNRQLIFLVVVFLLGLFLVNAQECSTTICGGFTQEICCPGYTCDPSPICCDNPGTCRKI